MRVDLWPPVWLARSIATSVDRVGMIEKLGRVVAAGSAGLSAGFAALAGGITVFWQIIQAASGDPASGRADLIGWAVAFTFLVWGLLLLLLTGSAAYFTYRAAYKQPLFSVMWSVAGLGVALWFIPAFMRTWVVCAVPPSSPFSSPQFKAALDSWRYWCEGSWPQTASVIGPIVSLLCLFFIVVRWARERPQS